MKFKNRKLNKYEKANLRAMVLDGFSLLDLSLAFKVPKRCLSKVYKYQFQESITETRIKHNIEVIK